MAATSNFVSILVDLGSKNEKFAWLNFQNLVEIFVCLFIVKDLTLFKNFFCYTFPIFKNHITSSLQLHFLDFESKKLLQIFLLFKYILNNITYEVLWLVLHNTFFFFCENKIENCKMNHTCMKKMNWILSNITANFFGLHTHFRTCMSAKIDGKNISIIREKVLEDCGFQHAAKDFFEQMKLV